MTYVRLQIFYGKIADREPPAPLRRYIRQEDWEHLVHEVEQNLVLDRQFQYAGLILIAGFFLSCLLLVSVTLDESRSDNTSAGLPVICFMILLFSMAMAQQCCIRPKIVADINQVLTDFSSQIPGISFHLMGDGNSKYPFFIQVYTDGHQYDGELADAGCASNNNICGSNNNIGGSLNISDRLLELHKIQHLLSESEYDEKRKCILENL